jgi:hypothetical protein
VLEVFSVLVSLFWLWLGLLHGLDLLVDFCQLVVLIGQLVCLAFFFGLGRLLGKYFLNFFDSVAFEAGSRL